MLTSPGLEPIDYLVIGHITTDLINKQPRLGGSALYAALTAQAMGLRVGVVTAWNGALADERLEKIQIANLLEDRNTTFELISTPNGRDFRLEHVAEPLDFYHVPLLWRNAAIVHLAPVVHEVSAGLARYFPDSFVGLTPQGWLRDWDGEGRVFRSSWPEADHMLGQCHAAVISKEDVAHSEKIIQSMALAAPLLAVTDGPREIALYMDGEEEHVLPETVKEVDAIGAGDIFAAAFFIRLVDGETPLEAARYASQVAARSVLRRGLEGAPTEDEIQDLFTEVNVP